MAFGIIRHNLLSLNIDIAGICVTLKNKVLEEYLWNNYGNVHLEKFLLDKVGMLDSKGVGNTNWIVKHQRILFVAWVWKLYLNLNFLMVPIYKKRVFKKCVQIYQADDRLTCFLFQYFHVILENHVQCKESHGVGTQKRNARLLYLVCLCCATRDSCRERSEEGPDSQAVSFQLYKVSRLEVT